MADAPLPGEELRTLRFLDALESEGASAKEFSSRHWEENMKQCKGDQWRLRRPPHFSGNLIGNAVNRKVAALTEAKPTIKIAPTKPGLTGAATILNEVTKAFWDTHAMDQTLYRVGFFGMTLGSSFLYTYWDPVAENFEGDIQIRHLDPRRVIIDPGVTEAEQLDSAAYVILDSFDTLANIRMRFPGRGLLVKADRAYSSLLEQRKTNAPKAGVMSAVLQSFPRVFKPGPVIKDGPIERAQLKEYFFADPRLGEDGQPLFPTGRHIIRAGDTILRDEVNPYWDGKWPIDMFDWAMDFDTPWGVSEVDGLRRIQEAFIRVGDVIVRNALLSSNVKIIGDIDALDQDKWDALTNEPTIFIKKRPGREIKYEAPPALPEYLFNMLTQMIQFTDLLTGNTDASGAKKGGVTSAAALEGLQASAQLLVRSVARRMEGLLERVGQKFISRVYQFMTHDRILQQLGPSHEWISYTYERQKLLQRDDGKLRAPLEIARAFRDFRFLVEPGSSLATTRVQRTMMLLQLRQALQIIPSLKRIASEADVGDFDEMAQESAEEMQKYGITPPPPQKKRSK